MSTTPFTTEAKLNQRLSSVGVALRIDHDPDNALTFSIESGTHDVHFYLQRYTVAQLATSEWVSRVATEYATYHLCLLRNNPVPAAVTATLKRYEDMLRKIQEGKANVPDLSPGVNRPHVVKQRVQADLYPDLRTTRDGTTGTPSGYSRYTDPYEPPLT